MILNRSINGFRLNGKRYHCQDGADMIGMLCTVLYQDNPALFATLPDHFVQFHLDNKDMYYPREIGGLFIDTMMPTKQKESLAKRLVKFFGDYSIIFSYS